MLAQHRGVPWYFLATLAKSMHNIIRIIRVRSAHYSSSSALELPGGEYRETRARCSGISFARRSADLHMMMPAAAAALHLPSGASRPLSPVDEWLATQQDGEQPQQQQPSSTYAATNQNDSQQTSTASSSLQGDSDMSAFAVESSSSTSAVRGRKKKTNRREWIIREAKAKFVWAVLMLVTRIVLGAIQRLALPSTFDYITEVLSVDSKQCYVLGHNVQIPAFFLQFVLIPAARIITQVSSVLVNVLPTFLFVQPGFLAAFPPLLQFLQSDFSLSGLPLVPYRVAQCVMGRLTPRQLAIVLPVHFVTTLLATACVRFVVPAYALSGGLEPIAYDISDENYSYDGGISGLISWALHFSEEVVVNALMVIGLRVLPELLRLNRVGNAELWVALIVVWPLCRVSVDSSGIGSTFSPDLVYALRCVRLWDPMAEAAGAEENLSGTITLGRSVHRLGPVVGGFVAGKIMAEFFPDKSD